MDAHQKGVFVEKMLIKKKKNAYLKAIEQFE